MKKEKIKISGYVGTWYVIDEMFHYGKKVYLLESEICGDEAACLIVNENLEIILDDVWNGFSDLED